MHVGMCKSMQTAEFIISLLVFSNLIMSLSNSQGSHSQLHRALAVISNIWRNTAFFYQMKQ